MSEDTLRASKQRADARVEAVARAWANDKAALSATIARLRRERDERAGEAETAEATVEEYEAEMTVLRLDLEAVERERDEARAGYDALDRNWSTVHETALRAIRAATVDGTIPEIVECVAALRAEVETLEAFCDRAAFLARDHMGCILANDCPPDCVWIDFCSRAVFV